MESNKCKRLWQKRNVANRKVTLKLSHGEISSFVGSATCNLLYVFVLPYHVDKVFFSVVSLVTGVLLHFLNLL